MIPYMIVYSDSLKTTVIFVWVQIWFLYDLIIVWDFSWIFSFFFFSKRNFVEFYWVCGGGGDSTQTNTHTGQQKKKKKKHWVGVVNCCKNFFFFLFHTRQSSYENGYLNLGGRETNKGWINQNRSACIHWHHLWFTTGTFLKMITGSWFLSTTVTFLPPPPPLSRTLAGSDLYPVKKQLYKYMRQCQIWNCRKLWTRHLHNVLKSLTLVNCHYGDCQNGLLYSKPYSIQWISSPLWIFISLCVSMLW